MSKELPLTKDGLFEAIKEHYRQAYRPEHGSGVTHSLTIWPDGRVQHRAHFGRCRGENEYFGRRPHELTIALMDTVTDLDPAGDYEWREEDDTYVSAYDPTVVLTREELIEERAMDELETVDLESIQEDLRYAFCLTTTDEEKEYRIAQPV